MPPSDNDDTEVSSDLTGPYRSSHRGSGKATAYDHDFWTPGTAKAQNWTLERALLDRVFADVFPVPPRRALDFACGTGRVLADLEGRVPETVGLDVSPEMLDIARTRCARSRLACVDVTDPAAPEPDLGGRFDVVTTFRFLLNTESPVRSAALAWIRERLRPDGRLVANFHLNPNSARGRYLRLRWHGDLRVPMLSLPDIEKLLHEAGFAVVDVRGYEYLPYRRDGSTLWAPRLRTRIEQALLARQWFRPIAGCYLVVAEAR